MKPIDRSHRTMVLAGLTAVGALTLAACSDGGPAPKTAAPAPVTTPSTTPPGTPTGAPTATASSTPTFTPPSITAAAPTSPSAAPAPAVPAPAPGTKVKIGDAVRFPFSYGGSEGAIALTVTSIEKADPADLSSLKLDDNTKGLVPYYIHYQVTNIGDTDLSFTNLSHISGLLANGTQAPDLMVFGTFAKCSDGSMPSEFTNGKSADFCIPVMSPTNSRVTAVEYWADPYTVHNGVIWK
ncbi:hypothetical protein OG689_36285 [Kitasatospora sp. NBC_00240]|uniref:hypothetical protein n=1 Tax=Kitasatospora sp. NBC_00240 TaxID=2903567 RepID=UPI002254DFCE|nr:hypothetical protein [Kitasatospora sp. NBC_00240]MCX5214656.1 hypothetical protein [Kitasatospora sp. NBC_00240]